MKKSELELRMQDLEESIKTLETWQHRHTKNFCFDCKGEGTHKIKTIDGFTVRSCDCHLESWVGCSCNGRIIGK